MFRRRAQPGALGSFFGPVVKDAGLNHATQQSAISQVVVRRPVLDVKQLLVSLALGGDAVLTLCGTAGALDVVVVGYRHSCARLP
jgi:hypothetical protein